MITKYFINLMSSISIIYYFLYDIYIHYLYTRKLVRLSAANFISWLLPYIYLLLRCYKVLCYSRMTLYWLAAVKSELWPFSYFCFFTDYYFNFWRKIIPNYSIGRINIIFSSLIGLHALNAIIYFILELAKLLIYIFSTT